MQNSNLVLEADREARGRREEATGEVEVWNAQRLGSMRMGDRLAGRSRPAEVEEKLKKSRLK
jgi:hypothetical protein